MQEKLRRATPDSIQGPLTTCWVGLATELVRRGQRETTVSASVDPEMWAAGIIDVIVGAFAFADPKMSAPRRARQLKEVARIVGSSLRDGA